MGGSALSLLNSRSPCFWKPYYARKQILVECTSFYQSLYALLEMPPIQVNTSNALAWEHDSYCLFIASNYVMPYSMKPPKFHALTSVTRSGSIPPLSIILSKVGNKHYLPLTELRISGDQWHQWHLIPLLHTYRHLKGLQHEGHTHTLEKQLQKVDSMSTRNISNAPSDMLSSHKQAWQCAVEDHPFVAWI